jgi:hypothetical protein
MTDLTLRILREIQADMRTIRDEQANIRQELANNLSEKQVSLARFAFPYDKASRTETLVMLSQIVDRFAKFEAHVESRFDAIEAKLGST